MLRNLIIVFSCLLAVACTTSNTRTASDLGIPPAGTTVLLVKPDVSLSLLTTVGMHETRADWSEQGASNLSEALSASLATSSYAIQPIDPSEVMGGQSGQLIRLHDAVGESISVFEYGVHKLPTKKGTFDWTLGSGTQSLRSNYSADYALFTSARGTYASGGRIAAAVAMSVLGVGVPLGSQQVYLSLVDLRTGQVIWFNAATAGPTADMRNAEGAASLVASLLKDAPL